MALGIKSVQACPDSEEKHDQDQEKNDGKSRVEPIHDARAALPENNRAHKRYSFTGKLACSCSTSATQARNDWAWNGLTRYWVAPLRKPCSISAAWPFAESRITGIDAVGTSSRIA